MGDSERFKFFWFLILAGLALVYHGGRGVLTAAIQFESTEYSCEVYDPSKHDAKWIRLTDCVGDWTRVMLVGSEDNPRQILLPLISPEGEDRQTNVILVSSEPRMTREYERIAARLGQADEQDVLHDLVQQTGAYEGLVRASLGDSIDRDDIRRLHAGLAHDFVVLGHNEEPLSGEAIIQFLVGLALLVVGLALPGLTQPGGKLRG